MTKPSRRTNAAARDWNQLLDDLKARLRAAIGEDNSREIARDEEVERVIETLRARGVLARRLAELKKGAPDGREAL